MFIKSLCLQCQNSQKVFPGPMFPKDVPLSHPYIPQSCLPYSTEVSSIPYVPQTCFRVFMFPRDDPLFLCSLSGCSPRNIGTGKNGNIGTGEHLDCDHRDWGTSGLEYIFGEHRDWKHFKGTSGLGKIANYNIIHWSLVRTMVCRLYGI